MAEKSKVIIDTDILIKIFRGNKDHKKVLESFGSDLIISCITKLELLFGCKNNKMQEEIEESLFFYDILEINSEIIYIANQLVKKYSFDHKLSLEDIFIAATANFYSLEIYSDNKKDFSFIEEISLFYPNPNKSPLGTI